MEGELSLDYSIKYNRHINKMLGIERVRLGIINIAIRIDPKIYIAHDYQKAGVSLKL